MRTRILEDDFTGRQLLQPLLKPHGPCHITINGQEAVEAVRLALEANEPYDLICLGIMMPKLDGHGALDNIRALEEAKAIWSTHGAKVVMTTASGNTKNVTKAFAGLAGAHLTKPVKRAKLLETVRQLELTK